MEIKLNDVQNKVNALVEDNKKLATEYNTYAQAIEEDLVTLITEAGIWEQFKSINAQRELSREQAIEKINANVAKIQELQTVVKFLQECEVKPTKGSTNLASVPPSRPRSPRH